MAKQKLCPDPGLWAEILAVKGRFTSPQSEEPPITKAELISFALSAGCFRLMQKPKSFGEIVALAPSPGTPKGHALHKSAEDMVKLFGVTAIVAMLVGGTFALFVALTRWEAIGLLNPSDFYKYLSVHAWYLLIFWMVFMEIAILYVGGPFVLGRRLALPRLSKLAYGVMVVGALVRLPLMGINQFIPPVAAALHGEGHREALTGDPTERHRKERAMERGARDVAEDIRSERDDR